MRRVLKWLGFGVGGLIVLFATFVLLVIAGVLGPPKVPPEKIQSSVSREPAMLDQAFSLPVAATYGRQLHFQRNGSYCGPASLVNVFRSFGENVEDEAAVLSGTGKCGLGFCWMGLSLDELADVARSNGKHQVEVLRNLSPGQFRDHLRQSNDPNVRYIVNFARKKIFEAGGGHHSPIGGYLEAQDEVLVLDVNEQFRPWVVEADRLYAAVDTQDGEKKRGLLRIVMK